MLYTRHQAQINYKSGNSITAWFYRINIIRGVDGIESIKWAECNGVNIMHIGMSNIESLVILKHRRGIFGQKEMT